MPRGISAINAIWRERQKAMLRAQEVKSHSAHSRHAFDPNQPRVPAGHPDSGQWTKVGADGADSKVLSESTSDKDRMLSMQYMQAPGHSDNQAGIRRAGNELNDLAQLPAQAEPFEGFADPSPADSLENQALFRDCERSLTGTLVAMKGSRYDFCSYGHVAILEEQPNKEVTRFQVVPRPRGDDVYGRDRDAGAWGRWRLAPGQRLIVGIDENDRLDMTIR